MIDYDVSDKVAGIVFASMIALLIILLIRKVFRDTDDKSESVDEINKMDSDENIKIIENAEKIIVSELIEASRDSGNANSESRVKELREIIAKAQKG
jgi:hypothetical protein